MCCNVQLVLSGREVRVVRLRRRRRAAEEAALRSRATARRDLRRLLPADLDNDDNECDDGGGDDEDDEDAEDKTDDCARGPALLPLCTGTHFGGETVLLRVVRVRVRTPVRGGRRDRGAVRSCSKLNIYNMIIYN